MIETHRIIPENVALGDLSEKWNALYKKNGKQSRLLWKRQYLPLKETLPPNDFAYANLTFRQAYFEYLRYPVGSLSGNSLTIFYNVAASLLLLENEFFSKELKANNVVPVLERLLPTVLMVMNAKKHGAMKNADRSEDMRTMQEVIEINCK